MKPCKCFTDENYKIWFCPLHKNAEEMLGALKGARMLLVDIPANTPSVQRAFDLLDAIIAKADIH